MDVLSPQIDSIPAELKELNQWVNWRLEERDGKLTKVPYVSGTNRRADSTDPRTWRPFESTVASYQNGRRYDGIGFVFRAPHCGVDLDKCITSAGLEPWASEILQTLSTYSETSPSGTGCHAILKGRLPGKRRRKKPIEMYDLDRYFCMTGRRILPHPSTIEERQEELNALYLQTFGPERTSKPQRVQASRLYLPDAEIVEKASGAKNGTKFLSLWHGDISGYPSQSEADLALCALLAFYSQDTAQIDRIFRQSGLYRSKWDRPDYQEKTIQRAIDLTTECYIPRSGTQQPETPTAPSSWDDELAESPAETPEPTQADAQEKTKKKRERPKSAEYIAALSTLGYTFRLNECDDSLEVNGQPITDPQRAEIRSRMRDLGYWRVNVAEDAYLAEALKNSYHPVKKYLNGLQWDGNPHIDYLATHFRDKDSVFPIFFRRWVIGAVAKVMESAQNAMLVLDGPQGEGKSTAAAWLCPLPDYFIEGPLDPSDKDDSIRLISKWIWEVGELGATMRKADREALKFLISRRQVTVRKPYGRHDINKPAMASLIGTINNEGGFLTDPTGNRRFLVVTLTTIDWAYTTNIDIHQVWAQAMALYRQGEPWELQPDEARLAAELAEEYQAEDPTENLMREHYDIDPKRTDWWISSADVLTTLQDHGLRGATRSNQMAISATLTRLGVERKKFNDVRGYSGIRRRVDNLTT